jgi:hypothetical protein
MSNYFCLCLSIFPSLPPSQKFLNIPQVGKPFSVECLNKKKGRNMRKPSLIYSFFQLSIMDALDQGLPVFLPIEMLNKIALARAIYIADDAPVQSGRWFSGYWSLGHSLSFKIVPVPLAFYVILFALFRHVLCLAKVAKPFATLLDQNRLSGNITRCIVIAFLFGQLGSWFFCL